MVERGGLENRCTARYRGFKSLSLRFFWKRGRAVIRRIANPWVPIWARQVRLLSLPFYKLLLERDCSSAGLERHPAEVEVARSNRVSLKEKVRSNRADFFLLFGILFKKIFDVQGNLQRGSCLAVGKVQV